jgi:hypothetical protein
MLIQIIIGIMQLVTILLIMRLLNTNALENKNNNAY